MAAARRLLELLRIPKEHDVGSRLRNRQDVGQRHLTRLVDKQYVDHLGPRRITAAGGPLYLWVRRPFRRVPRGVSRTR